MNNHELMTQSGYIALTMFKPLVVEFGLGVIQRMICICPNINKVVCVCLAFGGRHLSSERKREQSSTRPDLVSVKTRSSGRGVGQASTPLYCLMELRNASDAVASEIPGP